MSLLETIQRVYWGCRTTVRIKGTQSDQWRPATRLTTSRSDCDRSSRNELDFIQPMKIAPRLCQTTHKLWDGKVIRLYFQQAIWEVGVVEGGKARSVSDSVRQWRCAPAISNLFRQADGRDFSWQTNLRVDCRSLSKKEYLKLFQAMRRPGTDKFTSRVWCGLEFKMLLFYPFRVVQCTTSALLHL